MATPARHPADADPALTRQPPRWLLLLALAMLTAIGLHFDQRRSPGPAADSTTASAR